MRVRSVADNAGACGNERSALADTGYGQLSALAVEQAGDRVVAEHLADRPRPQRRPPPCPTTSNILTWLATSGSRRLWMMASGQPSRSVHRSQTLTRPASGATTVTWLTSSFFSI